VIISAYNKALKEALAIVERISVPIDTSDDAAMLALIKTSIGTKFVVRWSELMCKLALQAVRTVAQEADGSVPGGDNMRTVDIKRYARVEKVPGGTIEDSTVLAGVMLNKDIVHPRMRRRIAHPRIVLLDCPLEYKKGESQTNIEMSREEDFAKIQELEEHQVKSMVDRILEFKPDLVLTEKGISDYAQHWLHKAGVSAIRRVRKSDNNRVARATGATIVNRLEDLRESDIGTRCGLFNIEKIGDEYVSPMPSSFRYLTTAGQVLHLPHGMHDTQSVHHSPPRAVQGHPERDRAEPAGRDGRRTERLLQPDPRPRRRRDRDGHVRVSSSSLLSVLTNVIHITPVRSACTPKRGRSPALRAGRSAPSRTRSRSSRARSRRTRAGTRSAC
jgi:hypothetical protein